MNGVMVIPVSAQHLADAVRPDVETTHFPFSIVLVDNDLNAVWEDEGGIHIIPKAESDDQS